MKLKKILAAIAACAMSAAMISMTVSAAGVTGDDETLDDSTEIGDDISLDDDEGDDIADDEGDDEGDEGDDETVDNGDEETQAPTQTATNPTTGNSPIALAVIPVALAAAAVVAKKAK